jgi:hypothetical protein
MMGVASGDIAESQRLNPYNNNYVNNKANTSINKT